MPNDGAALTLNAGGDTAYPVAAQIDLRNRFVPDEYSFVNESVDAVMWMSVDGATDLCRLAPNEPTEAATLRSRVQRVWVRRDAAAFTPPATLRWLATTDA